MSSFLGAVLVFGRDVTLVLFAILSFLSFREFMSLTPTRRRRPSLAVLIVLCRRASAILADRDRLVRALSIFIPVYVFLMLPALSAVAGYTRDFLARNAKLQWA